MMCAVKSVREGPWLLHYKTLLDQRDFLLPEKACRLQLKWLWQVSGEGMVMRRAARARALDARLGMNGAEAEEGASLSSDSLS